MNTMKNCSPLWLKGLEVFESRGTGFESLPGRKYSDSHGCTLQFQGILISSKVLQSELFLRTINVAPFYWTKNTYYASMWVWRPKVFKGTLVLFITKYFLQPILVAFFSFQFWWASDEHKSWVSTVDKPPNVASSISCCTESCNPPNITPGVLIGNFFTNNGGMRPKPEESAMLKDPGFQICMLKDSCRFFLFNIAAFS